MGQFFGTITIYSQAHDKLDFFHFGSLPIINTPDWPEIFTVASQHTLRVYLDTTTQTPTNTPDCMDKVTTTAITDNSLTAKMSTQLR